MNEVKRMREDLERGSKVEILNRVAHAPDSDLVSDDQGKGSPIFIQ